MANTERKVAGRMARARACEYCVRARARWFCAADDAFLCESCDYSVHSANPMARRHERVLLKTEALRESREICVPVWQRGVTRKARTPRRRKISGERVGAALLPPLRLVPDDEKCLEETDEQLLLYRVPDFDPSTAELCSPAYPNDPAGAGETALSLAFFDDLLLPESEMDLPELAADFDWVIGIPCDDKPEEEVELKFENGDDSKTSSNFLSLNYEGVLSAWNNQRPPWINGELPDLNSGDCWLPDSTGTCRKLHAFGDVGMIAGHAAMDAGREARVSRYREKRLTRLFSKKIRYEVRKLNAEQRPRMKGRFVRRADFVA